jgi:hypothetical protein
MVKPLKAKKKKPRYLVEVAPGAIVTTGFCYRVLAMLSDDPDDYDVVKDWYGDYPTQKHANDAGRKWVFDHYDPETKQIKRESKVATKAKVRS